MLQLLYEVDIVEKYKSSDDYDERASWGKSFSLEPGGTTMCHIVGFVALDDPEFMKLRDVIKETNKVGGNCPAALVVSLRRFKLTTFFLHSRKRATPKSSALFPSPAKKNRRRRQARKEPRRPRKAPPLRAPPPPPPLAVPPPTQWRRSIVLHWK